MMWRPYYEVLSKSHSEVKTIYPETFVDSLKVIEGPERSIFLISKGSGHTESDLILYLPDDQIVFTGDLVFNQCHPYLGNGNLDGLKYWMAFLNDLKVKIVVPGHGDIGPQSIIPQMNDYVLVLENLAQEMILQGKTSEHIDPGSVPEKFKDWQFGQFFPPNMAFMLSQLNEE